MVTAGVAMPQMGDRDPIWRPSALGGGYITDPPSQRQYEQQSVYRAKASAIIIGLVIALSLGAPSFAHAQSVSHSCDTATTHDNCERWYTGPSVTLQWSWSQNATQLSGCQNGTFTAEGRTERSCTVMWGDITVSNPVWIGIDRTPPEVVGVQPQRPPDYNEWFNHPVGLTFHGTDRTSGVASCSSTIFGGPDGQGVPVAGSCVDVAGNVGSASLPINYDATPPAAPVVDSLPGDHRVALEWSTSLDSQAEVARLDGDAPPVVVYSGHGGTFTDRSLKNGRRYRYAISLIDQAGNRAVGTTSAVPTASKLLEPAKGERIRLVQLPLLIWKGVRKADYYNVQIFRGGRKVLSSWPRRPRFQVERRWRFGGKRYRLVPAKYCWYVWPGYGKRAKRDYGKRLGRSCFRIVR
jgi:hypothetical protein